MFLIFLIIHFSWVSFALSAILCANASSPAAEPLSPAGVWNASNEWPFKSAHTTGYLLHYICTITALVFCCYFQHALSQLLLKHHTSANRDNFGAIQPRVLKEKAVLKHFTTWSCKWSIQWSAEKFLAFSPSLHLFLPPKYQVCPWWRQH